jgi:hypothetical protein
MTQTAAAIFTALGLDNEFIAQEIIEMNSHQLTKTANRSVLGTMNDFAYLADAYRTPNNAIDLLQLSLRLAQTPCGPPIGATSAQTAKSPPTLAESAQAQPVDRRSNAHAQRCVLARQISRSCALAELDHRTAWLGQVRRDFVVATARVLDGGVAGRDGAQRSDRRHRWHRTQPGFESTVIGFDHICSRTARGQAARPARRPRARVGRPVPGRC